MASSSDTTVLILGAGVLASYLVDYLSGQYPLRIVVRDANKVDKFKAKAEVRVGDLKDTEFMKEAFAHVHTVISLVGTNVSPVPLREQNEVIGLAAKAGVKHFIPALFSPSLSTAPPGVLVDYLGAKEEGLKRVKESGMNWTALYAGCFTEVWLSMVGFDLANAKASLVGDGKNVVPWLTYQDVAQYIALSVNNPRAVNKEFLLGSENLSYDQVLHIAEQVTGKKFDVTRTTASELLKEYQNSTASGFEKGILGLKAIVASMGPTDLELLKATFPSFVATEPIHQYVTNRVNKK